MKWLKALTVILIPALLIGTYSYGAAKKELDFKKMNLDHGYTLFYDLEAGTGIVCKTIKIQGG